MNKLILLIAASLFLFTACNTKCAYVRIAYTADHWTEQDGITKTFSDSADDEVKIDAFKRAKNYADEQVARLEAAGVNVLAVDICDCSPGEQKFSEYERCHGDYGD